MIVKLTKIKEYDKRSQKQALTSEYQYTWSYNSISSNKQLHVDKTNYTNKNYVQQLGSICINKMNSLLPLQGHTMLL